MIVGKAHIKIEYTSEDGLIYWLVVQKGNRGRKRDIGGSDSFKVVMSDIKRFFKIKTMKNR